VFLQKGGRAHRQKRKLGKENCPAPPELRGKGDVLRGSHQRKIWKNAEKKGRRPCGAMVRRRRSCFRNGERSPYPTAGVLWTQEIHHIECFFSLLKDMVKRYLGSRGKKGVLKRGTGSDIHREEE